MKQFFKFLFASVLGVFISIALIFFVLVGVVSIAVSQASKPKEDVQVKEKTILVLDFEKPIVDQVDADPMAYFNWNTFEQVKVHTIDGIVDAIAKAKEDDRIVGVDMDFDYFNGNMANLEEVQRALIDFKESGKFITAHSEQIGQSAYFLYALADTISLYPTGGLNLIGLRTELLYFKKALEKWNINVEILRGPNNKYKSAVEPFLYDKMSPESREQLTVLQQDVWSKFGAVIANERGLSMDNLNDLIDSLHATRPDIALKNNLVDVLWHEDEYKADLMRRVGVEDPEDINTISLSKYAKKQRKKKDSDVKPWDEKDQIAIVYAAGEIRNGKSERDVMGAETVMKHLRKARRDSTIKGVIFRVNSPGGSALASDMIWREVELTRKEKPVVVSMGGLAASGGYYVSCGADRIFADETTITGSIGVFGMLFNLSEFMEKNIGITTDYVQTHENAIAMSGLRPLSPYAKDFINEEISEIYTTFKSRVAEGRNMTMEEVEKVAKGRVWTGKSAIEIGLVDELGSLEDAKVHMKSLLELEDVEFKAFPEKKDPFEAIIQSLQGDFSSKLWASYFSSPEAEALKRLNELKERDPIQARIPMDIVIK